MAINSALIATLYSICIESNSYTIHMFVIVTILSLYCFISSTRRLYNHATSKEINERGQSRSYLRRARAASKKQNYEVTAYKEGFATANTSM